MGVLLRYEFSQKCEIREEHEIGGPWDFSEADDTSKLISPRKKCYKEVVVKLSNRFSLVHLKKLNTIINGTKY